MIRSIRKSPADSLANLVPEAPAPAAPTRCCGSCKHRAYGDQRNISQCALKVLGDPVRKRELKFNGRFPAPRARNFGRKCFRWIFDPTTNWREYP